MGVAGNEDFGVGGVELVGGVFGAGEGAVALVVEAGADGFDRAREDSVVRGFGVGDGKAEFDGGEGRQHWIGGLMD
jgi:hypothetical protein